MVTFIGFRLNSEEYFGHKWFDLSEVYCHILWYHPLSFCGEYIIRSRAVTETGRSASFSRSFDAYKSQMLMRFFHFSNPLRVWTHFPAATRRKRRNEAPHASRQSAARPVHLVNLFHVDLGLCEILRLINESRSDECDDLSVGPLVLWCGY